MLKHKPKARPVTHRKTPTHLSLNLQLFSSLAQTPYFSTLFSPTAGLKGNHQNIVVRLSVISLASLSLFVVI